MTMRAIPFLLLILAGLTPFAPARAAEDAPGGYLGLSVGQTKWNDACDGLTSCDDTDVGWKVFGGYQFSRFLGVEGGYVDLGEASGTDTVSGLGNVDAEMWGVFVSGVGTLPIGDRFGLFGKIGAAYTDIEVSSSTQGSDSDDGIGLTFGVGGFMNILRNLSIRLEWERFQDAGGDAELDVDLISVGVAYKF
jgi:opacity protein-like surface antigen